LFYSIFFPKLYDQTSAKTLPLVFTIHGGGFCLGDPDDDDEWNRNFCDSHDFLVVALNYSKAPFSPFPKAIYDIEALMLAVIADESLPIDKSRVAVGGFSAGGNLALAVCQLPSIHEKVKPSAILPVYPVVDQTLPGEERELRRYFKSDLSPGMRSQKTDMLTAMSRAFGWSYIYPGQDLRDPLLSPIFAARETLPPNLYIVAAELDSLGHEAWRMACQYSGRPIPKPEDKLGQEKAAEKQGELILDNERFAFRHEPGDGTSIRWLLIPDQLHGFDRLPPRWHGGEESMRDAVAKTKLYQKLLGEWLHQVVWKDSASTPQ
jgi:acetyl esterase/lipase